MLWTEQTAEAAMECAGVAPAIPETALRLSLSTKWVSSWIRVNSTSRRAFITFSGLCTSVLVDGHESFTPYVSAYLVTLRDEVPKSDRHSTHIKTLVLVALGISVVAECGFWEY